MTHNRNTYATKYRMRDAREVPAAVSRSTCLSFTDEFALIDLRYEPVFRRNYETSDTGYIFTERFAPESFILLSLFIFVHYFLC